MSQENYIYTFTSSPEYNPTKSPDYRPTKSPDYRPEYCNYSPDYRPRNSSNYRPEYSPEYCNYSPKYTPLNQSIDIDELTNFSLDSRDNEHNEPKFERQRAYTYVGKEEAILQEYKKYKIRDCFILQDKNTTGYVIGPKRKTIKTIAKKYSESKLYIEPLRNAGQGVFIITSYSRQDIDDVKKELENIERKINDLKFDGKWNSK